MHKLIIHVGLLEQKTYKEFLVNSLDYPHELWSVVAERTSASDSCSGVVSMWVRIPAWLVTALVSLSKTLNYNCFVLRMGR